LGTRWHIPDCRQTLSIDLHFMLAMQAVDLACSINSWTKEDMLDHLAWVNEESERIAQEGDWSLQD